MPIFYKELPGNMPDCRTIELIMKELEHAGFFASKTIRVDFDPLQAMNNYGMRDEQEKCFALQKGPLGHDRLRTWSEGGKRGRMHFIGTENEDSVLTRSSEIVSEFLNKWNTNVVFISLTCRSESLKALVKNESAVARLYTIDQKNHDPNVILRKARGMVNRRFVRAIVVEGININPLSIQEWIDRFNYWRTTHEVIIGVCDDDLEATSNG